MAGAKEQTNTVTFRTLIEDVAHFLWVSVEGQRRAHHRRCDGNLKRVPRSAPIHCTVVCSSTSEDECLDARRPLRQGEV